MSGLTLVALGTLLMSSMGILDGDRAKYIHVRWRPEVGANTRSELEARFSLGQQQQLEGQTFGYDLLDDSTWNIRALVRHPAVEDTHHIDRERLAVAATAEDGEGDRRTGLAWRWGVEHLVPYVAPFGAVLIAVGAFAFCVSRRRLAGALAWSARTLAPVSNYLSSMRAGDCPRRPPSAVLVVLAMVVVRVLSGWDSTAGESDVWFPWLETQGWAPQRLVSAALLAAGALITFRVAARQSSAPWVALAIILVTVWMFPARGTEAGFLVYALVLWAGDRYIDRPGREGFWLLTFLTVVVSAFRVDHGLYVAVAVVAALFVRHARDGARAFGSAALGYAGSLAVMALLFLPLGQVHASLDRLGDRITDVVAARGELGGSSDAERRSEASRVVELTFNIRWAPGVDAAQRGAKEREYALADGQADLDDASGRTWRYRWDERPPGSVRRVLNDPAVEDTYGIDRASAQYVGRDSAPDTDFEWISALLSRASEVASAAATRGPRWLWVILPIAAALRLGRRAMRRTTAHPDAHADIMVLPALVLCIPIGRLVMQGAGDLIPVGAPVMPALAVVTAWLFTGPVRRRSLGAGAPPSESLAVTSVRGRTQHRTHDVYIFAGLALLTVLIHLYVNSDVTNDHAAYLAMARQIVYGDWPIRDFRDDGSLLQIVLSAAVQKIGGFHLLGEMLLSWAFFAAANCLTFWLAFRLSGSRFAAAAAAVLAVLLIPRPYAYSKLFIYPLAILALWRYVERPQMGQLAALAATTALAFLFRVDHGVVIAATSVVTLALVHAREPRVGVRQGVLLAGWLLLFVLPQFVYTTWSVDLPRYVESIVSFGTYADATREPWPFALSVSEGVFNEANAVVFLLDLFLVIAGIALVHAAVQASRAWLQRTNAPGESLGILVVVVMWSLMLPMLARGQYYTRIAEIGQPIAILGAWLAVRWLAVDLAPSVRWTVLGALLAATVVALGWRTPMVRFFTRPADVFRGAPFQSQLLKELATSPPIDRFSPTDIEGDRWMVRYAYLCTKPNDRLLITWFGPEVYFYAGRAFAGDRWVYLPFDNSPERQRQVVERLRGQSVPVAFVDAGGYADFSASWPALAAYLQEAYTVTAEVPYTGRVTRVLTHKSRVPSHRVLFANLPCFD